MSSVLVAIDTDGVLNNFCKDVIQYAEVEVKYESVSTFDFAECCEAQDSHDIEAAMSDTVFWRDVLTPNEAALEQLKRLVKDHKEKVVIVTSPYHGCEGWLEARKAWFEEHAPGLISKAPMWTVPTSSRHLLKCTLLLDDNLQTLQRRWKHGKQKGLLVNHPWNQGETGNGIARFATSEEAIKKLRTGLIKEMESL